MNEINNILILGNGFDLDLGLPTSYNHFMASEEFNNLTNNYFVEYLKQQTERNWIDIENEFKTYLNQIKGAPVVEHYIIPTDKQKEQQKEFIKNYQDLVIALHTYLSKIDYSQINKKSTAAQVLKKIVEDKSFTIFSFNYTNLKEIIKKVTGPTMASMPPLCHIHGSVDSNNIIFGVEDDAQIDRKYEIIIKSMSPHFHSNNIKHTLENAPSVTFFGHSLGETDYPYFREFFETQSNVKKSQEKPKNKMIHIFTKDENSRMELMGRLREMNNRQTGELYDLNNFHIYKNNEINGSDIEKFKNTLTEYRPKRRPITKFDLA